MLTRLVAGLCVTLGLWCFSFSPVAAQEKSPGKKPATASGKPATGKPVPKSTGKGNKPSGKPAKPPLDEDKPAADQPTDEKPAEGDEKPAGKDAPNKDAPNKDKPGKDAPGKDKPADPNVKPLTPAGLAIMMDANKDRKLDDREVRSAIDALQKRGNARPATAESEQILAGFDKNKNGKLEKDEAEDAAVQARLTTAGGKYVEAAFGKLDEDNDGFVNREEFDQLGVILGGKFDIRRNKGIGGGLFAMLDGNKDGKISLNEAVLSGGNLGPKARDGAQAAQAGDPLRAKAAQIVNSLDKDRDGKVSEKEAKSNKPIADHFKDIDFDIDGHLTAEELWEYENVRRKK